MKSSYSEFLSLKEAIPQSESWARAHKDSAIPLLHHIVADPTDPRSKFASMPYPLREALIEIIQERSKDLVFEALLRMKTRQDLLREDATQEVQAALGLKD